MTALGDPVWRVPTCFKTGVHVGILHMYVYIYIYMYMYCCTCIYIYRERERERQRERVREREGLQIKARQKRGLAPARCILALEPTWRSGFVLTGSITVAISHS